MSISDLLIYYGWPNSFNATWNNERVAQAMAKYNMIVLGDGVQNPSHGDYANTQIIIPRIKTLSPSTLIFGYVSANQNQSNFETKTDQWNTLAIHGILMDEAGYDYSVTRATFNTYVDYVHGRSNAKICFANAWNMDHIIGTVNDPSYPNSTFNPGPTTSHLQPGDWYLLESFCVNTTSYVGNYTTASDWKSRGDKAVTYRNTYGLNIAAVNIINNANTAGQALFNFCWNSALAYNLNAVGSSDSDYAASSASVTFWNRPRINLTLTEAIPSVIQDGLDANRYLRYGRNGRAIIDFTTAAQTSTVEKW